MRFFIALEIPDKSKDQIELVQKRLKEIIPNIRLTDPSKMHLTIAFVGEQEEQLKEKLVDVIQDAVGDIPPFTVTPAYIDGFPNLHQARVLWIGVKGDIDKLMVIRERIKDRLIPLGIEADERRYVPHITIAKVDHLNLTAEKEEKIQQIMLTDFLPIKIDSIKLFESIPEHGFHKHNTLAEIELVD